MAEISDKGRNTIIVAIIAAATAIAVPFVNHYLSDKRDAPAPKTSEVVQAPAQKQAPPLQVSRVTPTEADPKPIKRALSPKLDPANTLEFQEILALASELNKAEKYTRLQEQVEKLASMQPQNSRWPACRADLSVWSGDISGAESHFSTAAKLGDKKKLGVVADLRANEADYAKATTYSPTAVAVDQDWELYQFIKRSNVPGTLLAAQNLCAGVRNRSRVNYSGIDSNTFIIWQRRHNECSLEDWGGHGNALSDCVFGADSPK